MGDDQAAAPAPAPSIFNLARDKDNNSGADLAAGAGAGAGAAWTGMQGMVRNYLDYTHTGVLGLPDKVADANDLGQYLGVNVDKPVDYSKPPEIDAPAAGTAEAEAEAAFMAPLAPGEASVELEQSAEATAGEASQLGIGRALGGVGGGISLVTGALQAVGGAERAFGSNATTQDEFHGGADMVGGVAGMVGGAAGIGSALGAGVIGAGAASAAAVAAPVAAAIGLAVGGDHQAEQMGLWGKDDQGNEMGTFEALDHKSKAMGNDVDDALGLDHNSTGGEIVGGGVRALNDVANAGTAAVLDVGLGVDALGASSGLFGQAASIDGAVGKDGKPIMHNMGAFEALDHLGQSAGSGLDSALGIDQDSTLGKGVAGAARVATDVVGAGAAAVADVGAGIVGGVEGAAKWVGDLF